jgi:hypothetical protein
MAVQNIVGKGATSLGGGEFLNLILAQFLGDALGKAAGSVFGAAEPMTESGGQGSKYMITLPEAQRLEIAFASENFRRRFTGEPPLDPAEFLAQREAALRESAAQAGQRELTRKQVETLGVVAPAIAQLAGTSATASSNLGQQGVQSLLSRPNIDPAIQAMATGL